jgi:quercetin dioxygenase-like cupin family protein
MGASSSSGSARYYPAGSLPLRPDVAGARYWAISLHHAMLSYFEVDSGVRFETHQHESEQITWVLDGELCFELEGRMIPVQAGEAIAIPGNLPHAVFTRDRPARALDAWSPVPERYRSD